MAVTGLHCWKKLAVLLLAVVVQARERCTGLDYHTGDLSPAANSEFCAILLGNTDCNFQCVAQNVLVAEDRLSGRPLVVTSARRLLLHPTCVSWILVRSSARVSTGRGSLAYQHCRYWLRIKDSEATTLDFGIIDLSVENSDIASINLPELRQLLIDNSTVTAIDRAEIRVYPSVIQNSFIQDIFFVNISVASFTISNSTIGTIGPQSIIFNGYNLIFENVFIRNIKFKGINMLSGLLIMRNCTIGSAEINSIVTLESKIKLENVNILSMEKPGFALQSAQEVSISDLTISGQIVTLESSYFSFHDGSRYEEGEDVTKEAVITGFTNQYCNFHFGALLCDFAGVDKPVVFERNALPPQYSVTIANASLLRAVGDFSCAHIQIVNSSGRFISLVNATCLSGGKLSIIGSQMTTISTNTASSLTISSSTIVSLQAASVKNLKVINSTFLSVYDVIVSEEASCNQSHFLQVSSLRLAGSGWILDCKFDKITSLELDSGSENIRFSNAAINSISQKRGIWIRSGLTTMENVTIFEAEAAGIFLEVDSRLSLENVLFNRSVFGAISVDNEEQVSVWPSGEPAHELLLAIQRRTGEAGDVAVNPDAYVADDQQPHCFFNESALICDYSQAENAVVVSSSNASTVMMTDAREIIIRPTGSQFIVVSRVHVITVDHRLDDSDLTLYLILCSLDVFTAAVHSLALESSSLNSLSVSPDHQIMLLAMRNSTVREIMVLADQIMVNQVEIGQIRLLSGDYITIDSSSIETIHTSGFVFRVECFVNNSVMYSIEDDGFIIEGDAYITDTNMTVTGQNPIVVREYGSLILQNVNILSSDTICPFLILGHIEHISEVTINHIVIDSVEDFLIHCEIVDDQHGPSGTSVWDERLYGHRRTFWLGLLAGVLTSMFLVVLLIFSVKSYKSWKQSQLPKTLITWRNSSETVIYSGLAQTEPVEAVPLDTENAGDTEKTRLVQPEEA
ncbi:uncharacterized protein LOC108664825 [Hyalella azteca]|uniref:Uncharacterized protein LOC108664825 n=1 Tax=Hyalella azteca TaxID=294128 RepID=A0A8B7N0H4_HYAAZ|nr:uncharacterized protein LOC108664825 [Hyalella azteca]